MKCFYSTQGVLSCSEKESFYDGGPPKQQQKQPLPSGDYVKSCTGCQVSDCQMNAQPKTCKLTCNACKKDNAKTCSVPKNCQRAQYQYRLNSPVFAYDGELMNQDMFIRKQRVSQVAQQRAGVSPEFVIS